MLSSGCIDLVRAQYVCHRVLVALAFYRGIIEMYTILGKFDSALSFAKIKD